MPTIIEFTVKTQNCQAIDTTLSCYQIILEFCYTSWAAVLWCLVLYQSSQYSSHWVGHTFAALSPTLCHLVIYLLIIVLGQCPPADSAHRFPRPHQPAPHPTSKLHYNCQRRESFGTPKILIPSWAKEIRSVHGFNPLHKQHLGVKLFFSIYQKSQISLWIVLQYTIR